MDVETGKGLFSSPQFCAHIFLKEDHLVLLTNISILCLQNSSFVVNDIGTETSVQRFPPTWFQMLPLNPLPPLLRPLPLLLS